MADERKDRLKELSRNKNRTPIEETERAALAQEFPETTASLESEVKK